MTPDSTVASNFRGIYSIKFYRPQSIFLLALQPLKWKISNVRPLKVWVIPNFKYSVWQFFTIELACACSMSYVLYI